MQLYKVAQNLHEAAPGGPVLKAAVVAIPVVFISIAMLRWVPRTKVYPPQYDPCEKSSLPCRLHIPKIIHQTYKTAELPAAWKDSPALWKKFHPGWEYKLWTDVDNRKLIEDDYPWFLRQYDAYPHPIQRADAVRYFILHKYGGVYVDMDVQPIRNIEPMLLGIENMIGETPNVGVTNAFMASMKGSSFFLFVAKQLEGHSSPLLGTFWRHWEILMSTGPTFLWGIMGKYKEYETVTVMPATVWGKCIICDVVCEIVPSGYMKHVHGDSWHSWDSYITTHVIFCHWRFWVLLVWACAMVISHRGLLPPNINILYLVALYISW
eukprot:m.341483 g.341483  ORF g.341483 m.341483 type:complete len:322 (-) comp20145_c0_seq1:34-999(-)